MSSLPYDYYPNVLRVIDLIGQGHTRTGACDEIGLHIPTFESYVKGDETLRELLVEAEVRGFDAMADALLDPKNDRVYGQSDPKMAKIVSDNIKWFLSKKDGKRFGDKIEIKHEITLDRAITDAIALARARASDAITAAQPLQIAPPTDFVDAEYVVIDADDELLAELLS